MALTESELDAKVWQHLFACHFGQRAAVPRRQILETLQNRGIDVSDRQLRKSVVRLIAAGRPICTSPYGGYWVAQSQGEIDIAVGDLTARINELANRIRALKNTTIPKAPSAQLGLFQGGANG